VLISNLTTEENQMYGLIVRLMLVAALLELGMTWAEFRRCSAMNCFKKIEASVLRVEWRPISMFPEEGRRFRGIRNTAQ